ncbi:MAG TPA: YidC/Oxa1 family membrane protein insertase [Acidimicrobiales bacterium]|jgi:YidC/Oxa1 family membrane protein insertase|nr:YidC/Oxa1 family membrane protein insertase [Acidimicrobiales bacterium]
MLSTLSTLTTPIAKENALFSDIGKVFHPLFELFGLILAGIYSVVPNYAVSIFGLTVLIMLALTPVTIKSTKSMIAMQRLQPEMKKLQVKYKGPENREQLNQEMMKLYKENGTSPFGACLPSLLQMPFLIVLYSLIRGLSFGTLNKAGQVIKATPRYIPTGSKIYHNLVLSKGQMKGPFGMDLSQAPFSHHGTNQAVLVIPYLVLIGIAIFFQYYQMKQMNSRNPQAAAANPQMQTMQKFFPIIFGLIYLRVPAGATIYMVVSSAMRIGTQEFMFRSGMVTPVGAEREIGGTGTAKPALKPTPKPTGGATNPELRSATKKSTAKGTAGTNGTNGKSATNGKRPAAGKPAANGKAPAEEEHEIEQEPAPREHPRSRSKRTRKSR